MNDDLDGLVDELTRLLERSSASTIEVETDAFSVKLTRAHVPKIEKREHPAEREPAAAADRHRVKATTVGIFSTARDWKPGDDVRRGAVLGAIQSLGHMADITAPSDGKIEEILVATGAPVEYGQTLFAIAPA
jgi:biotin carboxyl carrier protein